MSFVERKCKSNSTYRQCMKYPVHECNSLWVELLAEGWWSEHIRVLDSKSHVVHSARASMASRVSQSVCCMHCYSVKVRV